MRRQFQLPEEDTEFLESSPFPWETVIEGKIKRVVIFNFPVLAGYNQKTVDLNVRIEAAYPDTQIDMVYFSPPLTRTDGKPISATASDNFDGKAWQRWSRHRSNRHPWRPGLDNLSTHLALVGEWLRKELEKK